MSEALEPERKARLEAVAAAMSLALGDDWFYVVIMGQIGVKASVNVVGNCPQEVANKFMDIIAERQAQGRGPHE